MIFLDWALSLLSDHSEAVITGVGLVATGAAWLYSGRARPRVRLLAQGVFCIEIENVGKRVAHQVDIRFTPPMIRALAENGSTT